MIGKTLLKWIGVDTAVVEPAVLDRAAAALDGMPPPRARYVAAFAYLLARVAGVDSRVTADETDLMHRLVQREAELSDDEATAVVDLALRDAVKFAGSHNLDVTREFMALSTAEQRLGLMRCLFAVSAADDRPCAARSRRIAEMAPASVATAEDNEIRRISRELRIEHGDFVRARAEVKEHLAVLRLAAGSSPVAQPFRARD